MFWIVKKCHLLVLSMTPFYNPNATLMIPFSNSSQSVMTLIYNWILCVTLTTKPISNSNALTMTLIYNSNKLATTSYTVQLRTLCIRPASALYAAEEVLQATPMWGGLSPSRLLQTFPRCGRKPAGGAVGRRCVRDASASHRYMWAGHGFAPRWV